VRLPCYDLTLIIDYNIVTNLFEIILDFIFNTK